jgi:hypothetical protein
VVVQIGGLHCPRHRVRRRARDVRRVRGVVRRRVAPEPGDAGSGRPARADERANGRVRSSASRSAGRTSPAPAPRTGAPHTPAAAATRRRPAPCRRRAAPAPPRVHDAAAAGGCCGPRCRSPACRDRCNAAAIALTGPGARPRPARAPAGRPGGPERVRVQPKSAHVAGGVAAGRVRVARVCRRQMEAQPVHAPEPVRRELAVHLDRAAAAGAGCEGVGHGTSGVVAISSPRLDGVCRRAPWGASSVHRRGEHRAFA